MDLDFTRSPVAPQSLLEAVAPIVALFDPDPADVDAATLAREGRHDVVRFGGYTPTRRVTMADLRRVALAVQREERVRVTREVGHAPVSAPELHEKVAGPDAQAIGAMLRQSLEDGRRMVSEAFAAIQQVVSLQGSSVQLPPSVADVILERVRQVTVEGYRVAHDDEHGHLVLAAAAAAYLTGQSAHWPWPDGFKPRSARENYVRAAALAVAAIDVIDRAAPGSDPDFAEVRRG